MTRSLTLSALLVVALAATSANGTTVTAEKSVTNQPTTFTFPTLPSNSALDDANGLSFALLDGTQNGSRLPNLTNGGAQVDADEPGDSFFAQDGSNVRIQVDLGASNPINQINTYSWHNGVRAPQFYKVYGAASPSNAAPDFSDAAFRDDSGLNALGYDFIASVDTRSFGGGQHATSIDGTIGSYRYILFDVSQANTTNGFDGGRGTFFGEIDIYIVPEPTSLVVLGFVGALLMRRRQ